MKATKPVKTCKQKLNSLTKICKQLKDYQGAVSSLYTGGSGYSDANFE